MQDYGRNTDSAPRGRAVLVGYATDSLGRHIRLTSAEDFRLIGGSEETHARMQEVALAYLRKLAAEGGGLDGVTREEAGRIERDINSFAQKSI
jgi:hypothetical protein